MQFLAEDPANERFFSAALRTSRISTWRPMWFIGCSPRALGEVEALHLDTYADADRFYSFRRATHRGEADYGRQLSVIALR